MREDKTAKKGRQQTLKIAPEPQVIKNEEAKVEEKPPRLQIIDKTHNYLDEYLEDENYERKKFFISILCLFCNIAGVALVCWSVGVTSLIWASPFNPGILALGSCLFLPTFYWIWFLFCQPKEVNEQRKVMHERRKELERWKGIRYRWSMGINEEEYQERLRQEAEEEAAYYAARNQGRLSRGGDEEGRRSSSGLDGRRSTMQEDERRESASSLGDRKTSAMEIV